MFNADAVTDTTARDAFSDYAIATARTERARKLYAAVLAGELELTFEAAAHDGVTLSAAAERVARTAFEEQVIRLLDAGCPAETIIATAYHCGGDEAERSTLLAATAQQIIASGAAATYGD